MNAFKLATIASDRSLPEKLYHGSGYKQDELKPGYQHSKKVVTWDKYESNIYLYATDNRQEAELLGISSAIEKQFSLKQTHFDSTQKTMSLVFEGKPATLEDIHRVPVWLYVIAFDPQVWIKNNNPHNKIDGEYKTQKTITQLESRDQLDVQEILKNYTVSIS